MTSPVYESGQYKNVTATGAVTTVPCGLMGFYVNNTSAGTLVMRDGGASGTVISGTITPSIGFHAFPAACGTGLYATITGTLDVTFFYIQNV